MIVVESKRDAAVRRRREEVLAAVARIDGISSVAALKRGGHSRHVIDRLCADGALLRLRKGWVALPTADPRLMAAARHGVVLTCVTQAERLGLFVLHPSKTPHVAAPPHSGRAGRLAATVHWATPAVPRPPNSLVDGIENVLVSTAGCLPFEDALVVWESAFRRGLTTPDALARLPLSPAARALLDAADIFSDSGLETLVVPRLRWLGLPLRRQVWIGGHRVDLLIGDRLVLQIDGATHTGPQRTSDITHDAELMLLGYHVIRVGYEQVVHQWPEVQERIMRAVAQGLHRA
ncbi:DUF559 domain-containing protein [Microbacterium sp. ET2]|uniref:endonuclease domain-containing protein n=1 Tax=Microbacterium albipurpureum TaxID=3050384 RepID=UPI00259D19E4|nr:DUF559 domain-containing protein [Microbacterium sp. ET2 (Ac-2212)]WJL94579.1 DUF559 domain-containing protein [Microbacterium sp. ET2 (Ac-2212)]